MIDAFCSIAHYADHLLPVLDAVPADRRGWLYAPSGVAAQIASPYVRPGFAVPSGDDPVLVAGAQDLPFWRRPKVLVQHGAGQTYVGVEHPSYAGGRGHEQADLFLCPRLAVCAAEQVRYPRARCAVVGCPKLTGWSEVPPPDDPTTVAFTFHWDCRVGPGEAGWAWPEWRTTVEVVVREYGPGRVLGHAHPRAARYLTNWWASLGVEFVPDARDLLARARTLILDNSSVGYEWAALGRPTVWLDGLGWAEASHGLRFGEQLPGPRCALDDGVDGLLGSIIYAQTVPVDAAAVIDRVYGGVPVGQMASRAAAAVVGYTEDPADLATYGRPRPCNC